MRRERTILALCALGFLGMSAEVRYEHREAVERVSTAWIPIGYGVLAALACLLAMAKPGGLRNFAMMVLALGVGVGGAGVWLHTEGDLRRTLAHVDAWRQPASKVRSVWPPAMAPMLVAGLSVVALAAAWPDRRGR